MNETGESDRGRKPEARDGSLGLLAMPFSATRVFKTWVRGSCFGCPAVEWQPMQLLFQTCCSAGELGGSRNTSFRGTQRSSSNRYVNGKLNC